jgi:transcription initiation factor TFIIF subunit beta
MADSTVPIKTEHIKTEPDTGTLYMEDELDESTDLEFYDANLPNNPYGTMYLARLPKYVCDAWAHLDDDAEIEIGKIRQFVQTDANGNSEVRVASSDRLCILAGAANPVP